MSILQQPSSQIEPYWSTMVWLRLERSRGLHNVVQVHMSIANTTPCSGGGRCGRRPQNACASRELV